MRNGMKLRPIAPSPGFPEREEFGESLKYLIELAAEILGKGTTPQLYLGKFAASYNKFARGDGEFSRSQFEKIIAAIDRDIKQLRVDLPSLTAAKKETLRLFSEYEAVVEAIGKAFSAYNDDRMVSSLRVSHDKVGTLAAWTLMEIINPNESGDYQRSQDYASFFLRKAPVLERTAGTILTNDFLSIASWYGMYNGFLLGDPIVISKFTRDLNRLRDKQAGNVGEQAYHQANLMGSATLARTGQPLDIEIGRKFYNALELRRASPLLEKLPHAMGFKTDVAVYLNRMGAPMEHKPFGLDQSTLREIWDIEAKRMKATKQSQSRGRVLLAQGEAELRAGNIPAAEIIHADAEKELDKRDSNGNALYPISLAGAYALKAEIRWASGESALDAVSKSVALFETAGSNAKAVKLLQKLTEKRRP